MKPKRDTHDHIRGSSLLVVGRLVAVFLNFAVQVLTVRYLDKADFGAYALAMSIVTIAAMGAALGMDKTASQFLPVYLQDGDRGRFWGAFTMMMASICGIGTLIIMAILAAWCFQLPVLPTDPKTQTVLAILSVLTLVNALDAFFLTMFAVVADPAAIFFRRYLLWPLLRLAAAIAVAVTGGSVYLFAAAQAGAGILGIFVYLWTLRQSFHTNSELNAGKAFTLQVPIREISTFALTLLSSDVAYLLRSASVPLLIGYFHTELAVASFGAVMPVARLNDLVMLTFTVLFVPQAARLYASHRRDSLVELCDRSLVWIIVGSFPIFAATTAGAPFLTTALFGTEYADSAAILMILALGHFINSTFGGINLRLLRVAKRLRAIILMDLMTIALALAANLWFIPRFGALGGAWSVLAIFVVQAMGAALAVRWLLGLQPVRMTWFAPLLLALAVAGGLTLLGRLGSVPGWIPLALVLPTSILLLYCLRSRMDITHSFPELARNAWLARFLGPVSDSA